jgi:gliding motility-associated-like protein
VKDKNCIEFTGENFGKDKACIVQCNAQGVCDTTILVVTVVGSKKDTVNITVDFDKDLTQYCLDTSDLSGKIKSLKNVCATKSGTKVQVITKPTGACIDLKPIAEGKEQACIEICDNAGVCDTTIININATKDGNKPPTAKDDLALTAKNTAVDIDVKSNDKIVGFTRLEIVGAKPTSGTTLITPNGTVIYTPNKDVCDSRDSFTYVIYNAIGKDTAHVKVTISCEKIKVLTGFSPNGDGVNETLHIAGIENFPNSEITIFNRWGAEVYFKTGYTNSNGFTGRWNGKELPDGTYFYVLDLKDGSRTLSGYIQIHR